MSKKNLIIAAVALGLIAVLVQVFSSDKNKKADSRIDLALAEVNLVESTDEVVIEDSASALHLVKRNKDWFVSEKDDYPVDMKKLVDLFDKLTTYRVASLVTRDSERLAHFKLYYPKEGDNTGSTGTQVLLKGSGKTEFKMVVGKNRDSVSSGSNSQAAADGTYIRIGDEKKVFLIKENLAFNTDIDDWLNKTLVNIDEDRIKMIRFETQNGHFAFSREKKEDQLKLKRDSKKEKTNQSEISAITSELKDFSIETVIKKTSPIQKKLSLKSDISVELFDESVFSFQLLEKSKADPLKKDKEAREKTYYVNVLPSTSAASKEKWRSLYSLSEKWLFEIDEWQAKKWLKSRKDFISSDDS